MGKPFEIELEIGAVSPVRFLLEEETIRQSRDINVRADIAPHGPEDKDERPRLLRGAIRIVRKLLDTNTEQPIRVFNGPEVWVVPTLSVRAVRIFDPEAPKKGSKSIGFRVEGGTEGDSSN